MLHKYSYDQRKQPLGFFCWVGGFFGWFTAELSQLDNTAEEKKIYKLIIFLVCSADK